MGAEKKSRPKEQKASKEQLPEKPEVNGVTDDKTSDDPHIAVVQKTVRKYAKKLERIKQTKEKAASGVKLLEEQEKLVAQEPDICDMLKELNGIVDALKRVAEDKVKEDEQKMKNEGSKKTRPLIQLCYLLTSFAPAAEAARQRLPQLGLSPEETKALDDLLVCAEARPYAAFEAAVECEAAADALEVVMRRVDEVPAFQEPVFHEPEPPQRPPPPQHYYDGASIQPSHHAVTDNYGGVELGGQEYAPVHFGSWEAPAEQAPQELGGGKPDETGEELSQPNGTASRGPPQGDGRKGEDGRKGKSGKAKGGKGKDGADKGGDKGGYHKGSYEKGDGERKGKGKGKGKGKSESDKGGGKGKKESQREWGANQQ